MYAKCCTENYGFCVWISLWSRKTRRYILVYDSYTIPKDFWPIYSVLNQSKTVIFCRDFSDNDALLSRRVTWIDLIVYGSFKQAFLAEMARYEWTIPALINYHTSWSVTSPEAKPEAAMYVLQIVLIFSTSPNLGSLSNYRRRESMSRWYQTIVIVEIHITNLRTSSKSEMTSFKNLMHSTPLLLMLSSE